MVFCVIRRKPYHLFWIGEEGMKASFDVTLSPKDLYRFNMYQTYTGFQGWSSIALGILGFVMAGTGNNSFNSLSGTSANLGTDSIYVYSNSTTGGLSNTITNRKGFSSQTVYLEHLLDDKGKKLLYEKEAEIIIQKDFCFSYILYFPISTK